MRATSKLKHDVFTFYSPPFPHLLLPSSLPLALAFSCFSNPPPSPTLRLSATLSIPESRFLGS